MCGFKIIDLVKFDCIPARWSVTLRLSDGEALTATMETEVFHLFDAFRSAFHEQTHVMLDETPQTFWTMMIRNASRLVKVKIAK